MALSEEMYRLLEKHRHYYDVNTNPLGPFCASAEFHSHDSHYFLTKRASIGEAESHEYVYFADVKTLDLKEAEKLVSKAWESGLKYVEPSSHHRNSDVVLIIVAERLSKDAARYIKKVKLFKSYSFSFEGWSAFKVIALETSTGRIISNKRGRDLKKLFS